MLLLVMVSDNQHAFDGYLRSYELLHFVVRGHWTLTLLRKSLPVIHDLGVFVGALERARDDFSALAAARTDRTDHGDDELVRFRACKSSVLKLGALAGTTAIFSRVVFAVLMFSYHAAINDKGASDH